MESILKFSIDNQKIQRLDKFTVVEGSENYLKAQFSFSSDWDGMVKNAVFINEDEEIFPALLDENNMCDVPHSWITDQRGFVGVIGTDENRKITTNTVGVYIKSKGYDQFNTAIEQELQAYFDQLIAEFTEKYLAIVNVANTNEQTITTVQSYAESAAQSSSDAEQYKNEASAASFTASQHATNASSAKDTANAAAQRATAAAEQAENAKNAVQGIYDNFPDNYIDTTLTQQNKAADAYQTGQELSSLSESKVDKIQGKDLSTNDYDDTAKAKVDAIPENPKYTDTVYDDTALQTDVTQLKEDNVEQQTAIEQLNSNVTELQNSVLYVDSERYLCLKEVVE